MLWEAGLKFFSPMVQCIVIYDIAKQIKNSSGTKD